MEDSIKVNSQDPIGYQCRVSQVVDVRSAENVREKDQVVEICTAYKTDGQILAESIYN